METTKTEGQGFHSGAGNAGGPGIEFTETMRGFVSTKVTDEYQAGRDQGEHDGSKFEFTATITAPNIDRLVADPAHEALLRGTVTAPAFSATPLRVEGGRFNLLVRDAQTPDTRKMLYHMPAVADDGRTYHVEGFKTIHDDAGPDVWSDTTTLFVTVREGNVSGPVVAKGIVNILVNDFLKQLTTMKAIGASNKLEEIKTLAKFGRFFMGALNEIYGGVFARLTSSAEASGPP